MSSTLNDEKKFDLLFHTLEKYNQRYVTATMTVAGMLIVIIGWVLTNNVAICFFKSSVLATVLYMVFIPFQIFGYIKPMNRVFDINHKCYNQLLELNYVAEEYYAHHKLPDIYKKFSNILNVSNYIIIGILVTNAQWEWLSICL